MIKAVLFDLFGTLVPELAPQFFHDSLHAMADAVGVEREMFRREWIEETHYDRSVGTFETIAANILHICEKAGANPDREALARAVAIRNDFTRSLLLPRPDAVATLAAIREAGLRLALVSDCSAEVPELWASTPFAALIEHPVFSCRARAKKPDPRIFLEACRGLDVRPEECIYVADGMSQELTGAASLGMHPVLIVAPGEDSPIYAKSQRQTWEGERIERLWEVMEVIRERGG